MITASPIAPDGCVTTLSNYAASDFPLGSAVLCRNNASLVAHAFALLRRDMPVRILGRDLGQGLLRVIEKTKATTPQELQSGLHTWHEREAHKCKTEKQRDALEDKFNCLRVLVSNSNTIAEIKDKIERLFVADTGGAPCVTLATGHKAKGREWDHVFILDRGLIPSKWSTERWEKVQERNLLFVMVTRARLTLTYINSNQWKSSSSNATASQ